MILEVFISYAHQDQQFRNELDKHLSNLKRQEIISSWSDSDIAPGTEWRRQVMSHLDTAQIILLLISADFMASDFCYSSEMTRALERHRANEARVLPIILRPTDWKDAPFAALEVLPTGGKAVTSWSTPDDAYENVIQGIRRAIQEMATLIAEYKGDRVGQQLGPYRLTRLLGVGGFGEVYEADHRLLEQKRAIKLLLERHFHDSNQRKRFLREARILAELEHPNIVRVLEVGEEGNVLYLVMPFYRLGTLNDLLKQRTTSLPLGKVERFLAQMCAAVDYAHARHIVHLDLKPENMLMHEDGRLVLSDFGLAHLIKQGRLEAGSSADWGTPYYMAPEQFRGKPEQRSDLYALGVILYQLLTNQRPFTGNAPEAVMMKHLLEAPPPLRAISPVVPAKLELVIQKALEKQPENRYATAEALLADFHAAVSSPSPRPDQPSVFGKSPAVPTPPMKDPPPVVKPTTPVPSERAPHAAGQANVTKTTAAVCEIKLQDGCYCGVTAIGRCTTCGRAFCSTHQWSASPRAPGSLRARVDICLPCFEKQQLAELENTIENSYAARTALLNVPPVDLYKIRPEWKDRLFGLVQPRGNSAGV